MSTSTLERRDRGARLIGLVPRVGERLPEGESVMTSLPRRRRYARRLAALDAGALGLGIGACLVGSGEAGVPGTPVGWALVYLAAVMISIVARAGYRFRLQASPLDHLAQVYISSTLAAMIVLAARVLIDPSPDLASQTIRMWAFAGVFLYIGRVAASIATRRADRRGMPTLIVGAGTIAHIVSRRLGERPELGLTPIGYLDKEPPEKTDLPVLGASWDLERVVREHRVDHVVVTFSTAPHEVMLNLIRRCRKLGVEISLVPRFFEEVSNRVQVEHLGGVALLRVDQADPRGWQFECKYLLDRVIAAVGAVLLAPLLVSLALAVRLTSPGPILFRQRRVGLDGSEFDMLKFRTMRELGDGETDDWAARALGGEEAPPKVDRRTPIGRFLRRWSLDELPQVLNVLQGDMSLVGPRPELPGYVETFERHVYRYGDRHRVKSGLTGWAQVSGLRGETSLTDRIEWDNYYVENWTPWLDLKILLLTLPAVLTGRGAA